MKLSVETLNDILGCICIGLGAYLMFVAIKTNMLFYCTNAQTTLNLIVPGLASFLICVGCLVVTLSIKGHKI